MMFGREYLDWCAEEAAGASVDRFLAGMGPEDRRWVLAVLRKRFEVRVEYRDSLQNALLRQQSQLTNHPFDQHRAASAGGLTNVLGL